MLVGLEEMVYDGMCGEVESNEWTMSRMEIRGKVRRTRRQREQRHRRTLLGGYRYKLGSEGVVGGLARKDAAIVN